MSIVWPESPGDPNGPRLKPSLTEFLLARIADARADIQRRGAMAVGHSEACIYEGGYEGTTACDCGAVMHALAECEAKRRIVEDLVHLERQPLVAMPTSQGAAFAFRKFAEVMAAVYADHPDYNEEWRP